MQVNKLHQFIGKESFSVKDFIYLLNKLNPDSEVIFGVLYEKENKDFLKAEFNQNENIILYINGDVEENNYEVQILTKA
jgi:hypothetical protein